MAHYSEVDGDQMTAAYAGRSLQAAPVGGFYKRFLKRTLDMVAILLAAPFVLPVVLLLGLLSRLDGGPMFYTQERVGLGGRRFKLWKLRSMVVDADAKLQDYLDANPAARAEWDETQKLKNDPRITRVGRFIRKTSLDELPQLWNVFRGDMSLVGPRPMLPSQQALYPGQAYYELRPGLTGFWQISDRNESSFAGRAVFDTQYAERLSLVTDTIVIFMTVRTVLRGTGY